MNSIKEESCDFIGLKDMEITNKIKRILCPCDLNPTSRPAFDVAVSIADFFKTELTVLITPIHKSKNDSQ